MIVINLTISLIGSNYTGKTKFSRLIENKDASFIDSYIRSMVSESLIKEIIFKDRIFRLIICDTTGSLRYIDYLRNILKNANIILIFFESLNRKTFEDVETYLNIAKNSNQKDAIYALIESKYDLKMESKDENKSTVSNEEILEYVEKNNLLFFHLSNNEKYEKGINEILSKILKEYIKKASV